MTETCVASRYLEPPERMRRIPQQARSRRVVSAIVDSGLVILNEHGREGLSTTSLELVSGVPKSTIYEYFPNLDAVVAEVFHQVIRDYHETGYSRYPLAAPITLGIFIESVVDWVLSKHKALLALDRDFYLRFSRFFDFWMEFDRSFHEKDSVADFLMRQLRLCDDFTPGPQDHTLAQMLGRSLSLTSFVMLQENPDLAYAQQFRKSLVDMFVGLCSK